MEPEVLLAMLADHTDFQGQKLIADYIGKWLPVTGSVVDVTTMASDKVYVQIYVGPEETLVGLLFDPGSRDRLAVLRKGDVLNAMGQIREISKAAVTLEYCEMM